MLWKYGRRSDNIANQQTLAPGRWGGLVGSGIGAAILALVVPYFGGDSGVVTKQVAQQAQVRDTFNAARV